jgi:acyl carrier protein phosphodiesterase
MPDPQRELFNRFSREATNFPLDAVNGAALNVFINSLRQTYPKREEASRRFDEITARMKAVLMDHYDSFGRKKGIFPYRQVVELTPSTFGKKNGH